MDFYNITPREWSNSRIKDYTLKPSFNYTGKDIVCKGGGMYAFWYNGIWNTKMEDLIKIIDSDVKKKYDEFKKTHQDRKVIPMYMRNHDSGVMSSFREYTRNMPEDDIQFNTRIIFSDEKIKREDYATEQLSYTPKAGDTPAFDEMFGLLYSEEEFRKIMWFIGAVLTNSMWKIQKFLFLYGGKGTGKGTALSIFKKLFEGYYSPIDLHKLTSGSEFATSGVKETPLLIDDDADLYSIRDDTNLLKLTAHDPIIVNNKYQSTYTVKFEGLLVAASNQPFKVRNVDSGITRRAVVAEPTNNTHPYDKYRELMNKIDFELPYIAQKAIDTFNSMGPGFYEDYFDHNMIERTDHFYSFMRENAVGLGDLCTLKTASELYKLYLEDLEYDTTAHKRKVKEGLMRYYNKFYDQKKIDGVNVKNVFEGLKWKLIYPEQITPPEKKDTALEDLLRRFGLREGYSKFDDMARTYPAQLTTEQGIPKVKWDNVKTCLEEIDTTELHYVRLPLNHIVIDLDIKNEEGNKDLKLNLEKVIELGLPDTYMETSKSGEGIHLHYIFDGDPNTLKDIIEENVEIKVFKGRSSLRRKLTLCNESEIATISTGLPKKEEEVQVYEDIEIINWNERKMRTAIKGNLQRKYHANTKPSIDFIVKIFNDAEKAGVKYDLNDMRQDILSFAASSSNQSRYCINAVSKIKFSTIEPQDASDIQKSVKTGVVPDSELYFYDLEVFPNLFIVGFKKFGDSEVTTWLNPTREQIVTLVEKPLVGFNNRRYDNHILYSALLGEDNLSLFRQSQRIIHDKNAGSGMYGGAYELSYTDIYDYLNAGNKKSLKKWEVELGIKHDEFELPWDQPVPEDMWERAAEYCENDVRATEEVFMATKADYNARRILSVLSGLSMNATTNQHTTAIIFEGHPKSVTDKELVYTDLSKEFPGYTFEFGKSSYRGEDPGEGGYVYAEPGIYKNVGLLDVESMHPTSIIELNMFGKYTKNFRALVDGRLACKHDDIETLRNMFDGKLQDILNEEGITIKDISNGLKTGINSVYGLTAARFDNQLRHKDNVDNIVAKRGALFMIDLKHAIQEKGYSVTHIKTDSIKIPEITDDIIEFASEFAKKYGYTFEVEAIYDKLGLINKSTYASKTKDGKWEATGTQLLEPYVFKTLFSKDEISKEDLFITKEVKNADIYLGDKFIGRLASIYASKTGEEIWRVTEDRKGHISGTKGFKWKLSSEFTDYKDVDMTYYQGLIDKALEAIGKVGVVTDLVDGDINLEIIDDPLPI